MFSEMPASSLCRIQFHIPNVFTTYMLIAFSALQTPLVTLRTASLTFSNSTLCPQSVFMCFVWI